jgi:Mg2+ and Co2+ transporter CorA
MRIIILFIHTTRYRITGDTMDRDPTGSSGNKSDDVVRGEERFMRWKDWQDLEQGTRYARLRSSIDAVFSDSLMIALSLILIPVILIPFVIEIPPSGQIVLTTINGAILAVFILEYIFKLTLAENHWQFFANPWHLLDLFIIAAPIAGILSGSFQTVTGSFRLLRLIQLSRSAALGTRAYSRQEPGPDLNAHTGDTPAQGCMIRILYPASVSGEWITRELRDLPDTEHIIRADSADGITKWYDFTLVQEADLPKISRFTGVSVSLLDEAFRERAFPWARSHRNYAAVYLKIRESRRNPDNPRQILIAWRWILIVSKDHTLLTLSAMAPRASDLIARQALSAHETLTPAEISYRFFEDALSRIEETLRAIEDELEYTGSLPISEQPASFLPATFRLKKESIRIHSWLLHTRDVLNSIVNGKVSLHGMEDGSRFAALLDRASYLYDISNDITENVSSLTDYYFNATSFQMGRVMKLIAVLSALTIIPTVVGSLLGSNLEGNPWPISLAQIVVVVGIAMLATAWVYYRLGWLKT